jgi:hypothetical protein
MTTASDPDARKERGRRAVEYVASAGLLVAVVASGLQFGFLTALAVLGACVFVAAVAALNRA